MSWSGDTRVPNVGISASPSAVTYQDHIYVFHQGASNNGELWYDVFNGYSWHGDTLVPHTSMSSSPFAVVYREKIYVFHQGARDNAELWYNIFDGSSWWGDKKVPGVSLLGGPCAMVVPRANGYHNCKVYYRGTDHRLYEIDLIGDTWDQSGRQGGYGDVYSPSDPSGASQGDQIFEFWEGRSGGDLWAQWFDGERWHQPGQVQNTGISGRASPVFLGKRLYVFHQGAGNNGELWYNGYFGGGEIDHHVPSTSMSEGPSAVAFQNKIFCFHQGAKHNGELWYNVFRE